MIVYGTSAPISLPCTHPNMFEEDSAEFRTRIQQTAVICLDYYSYVKALVFGHRKIRSTRMYFSNTETN